jgi:hypothetical protein
VNFGLFWVFGHKGYFRLLLGFRVLSWVFFWGGLTRVFLCIHIVYLEAHCAFFDIYNITYK